MSDAIQDCTIGNNRFILFAHFLFILGKQMVNSTDIPASCHYSQQFIRFITTTTHK